MSLVLATLLESLKGVEDGENLPTAKACVRFVNYRSGVPYLSDEDEGSEIRVLNITSATIPAGHLVVAQKIDPEDLHPNADYVVTHT